MNADADGRYEISDAVEQDAMLSVSVIVEGYVPLRMPSDEETLLGELQHDNSFQNLLSHVAALVHEGARISA